LQEQATLSHETLQSLKELLLLHKVNERFPKDGFNNAMHETRKTLIKDIFPRFGVSNEYKVLYRLKQKIDNKNSSYLTPCSDINVRGTSTLTSHYTSSSITNNQNIWCDILPTLNVLLVDDSLCNTCNEFVVKCNKSSTQLTPKYKYDHLFQNQMISLVILLSDAEFYALFQSYLTVRYCCEHLKCYRCILIYILNYKKETKETFERSMYIYINFISGKGMYEVCVPPGVKESIEYKLAHPGRNLFQNLMNICFIEMENCLHAIGSTVISNDDNSHADVIFINKLWNNIHTRVIKLMQNLNSKKKKRQETKETNGSINRPKGGCSIL
jgi:hypothetical protein